ncbi:hypothetical protein C8R48DRAFT_668093 [Suillus tomentosus]|nr:hypothetical protein C8R48DRAFT_668093 [Suillus tomentosus]
MATTAAYSGSHARPQLRESISGWICSSAVFLFGQHNFNDIPKYHCLLTLDREPQHCNYNVGTIQIDLAQRNVQGDWGTKKTYTETDIKAYSDKQLQRSESWIDIGTEIYPYYYVIPENHVIAWIELVNGYLLLEECTMVWHWNHKRNMLSIFRTELKCMFLKTINSSFNILDSRSNEGNGRQVGHYQYIPDLNLLFKSMTETEELARPTEIMEKFGITICDPENSPFMASAGIVMLWIPIVVLKQLEKIDVNGVINGIDIKAFTDDFSAQSKAQTTGHGWQPGTTS